MMMANAFTIHNSTITGQSSSRECYQIYLEVDSIVPVSFQERLHALQCVYAIGHLAHKKAIRRFCLVLRRKKDARPP